jgi:hypothetical protein
MTTLSARPVRCPRRRFVCDDCERTIAGQYIRLYGRAHDTERMGTLRMCLRCCQRYTVQFRKDPKLAAALAALERG